MDRTRMSRATRAATVVAWGALVGALWSPAAQAQQCQVQGVWALVSENVDGRPIDVSGRRDEKFVGKSHFMWLSQHPPTGVRGVRTAADSERVFDVTGGEGTYTLSGNTYREHLESFYNAGDIGQTRTFTCRTEGDRWHLTRPGDPKRHERVVEEVWRRIE